MDIHSWVNPQTVSPSEPPFRGWTFCFVLFIRDLSIMELGINFTIIINFNIFANSKCISLKFHKYIAFHFASELWIDIHCWFCIRLCRIIPRFENPYINSVLHCRNFIKPNKESQIFYININKANFPNQRYSIITSVRNVGCFGWESACPFWNLLIMVNGFNILNLCAWTNGWFWQGESSKKSHMLTQNPLRR